MKNIKKNSKTATTRSLDSAVIVFKAKKNPCRQGTFCFAQVEAAKKANGKTVATAQQLLDRSGLNPNKRRIETAWLANQGIAVVKKAA